MDRRPLDGRQARAEGEASVSLADDWTDYDRNVLPRGAGAIQRIETRRAFYAGAFAAIEVMKRIGDDDVSEDQAIAMMQGLSDEIETFRRNVGEGGT